MRALSFKKKEMHKKLMEILRNGSTCSELCGVNTDLLTRVERVFPFVSKQCKG